MKKKIGAILGVALVAVMLVALLVGCVPTDPEKAETNLKDADYTTVNLKGAAAQIIASPLTLIAEVDLTSVKNVVSGTKGSDTIVILYFNDSDAAKAYYTKLDEAMQKLSSEEREDAGEYGRNGVAVYLGTSAAVKAAK